MVKKKKVEYESIKVPKNTANLLREIKDVTGISILRYVEQSVQYCALMLPDEAKDKIKILKFLR